MNFLSHLVRYYDEMGKIIRSVRVKDEDNLLHRVIRGGKKRKETSIKSLDTKMQVCNKNGESG